MCGIVGVIVPATRQSAASTTRCCCCSTAARTPPASSRCTARSASCTRPSGMVRDIFRTRNMRALPGRVGLGQVRYPTAGSAHSEEEAQPFYVNAPFGLVLVHNGNLTNTDALRKELFDIDRRHINTDSDTEVLINILAHELELAAQGPAAVARRKSSRPSRRVHAPGSSGSYAVVCADCRAWAAGVPGSLRASARCASVRWARSQHTEWMVASESVALEGTGHQRASVTWLPGEALFIDLPTGSCTAQQCATEATLCSTPASSSSSTWPGRTRCIDGVSVYHARLNMGETLAQRVLSTRCRSSRDRRGHPDPGDRVAPPPCSSHRSIGKPYREGFVKNRYVGRTFIMPGQAVRKKSRAAEAQCHRAWNSRTGNVLLVDDSIVRGHHQPRRSCRWPAKPVPVKVYMASAAPPVRFPNVYGIDMPTREELIAAMAAPTGGDPPVHRLPMR
jgi:amidophosphoribosyltransferase